MPYFTQNGANGSSGANFIQERSAGSMGSMGSMGSSGSTGSSFAARFGRILLRDGIAALPSALYHFGGKLDLYAQHIWFISYILSHKWDEDLPYPSLSGMSNCSGVSKRQLQRYRDELQSMGYLLVYPRRSERKGQETNAYDFAPLFAKIEHLLAERSMIRESTRDAESAAKEGWGNPEIGGSASDYAAQRADPAGRTEWERAERDPSFVARYGRVIARYGIAAVPRALFTLGKALALTPQQVWFTAYIFSYQWDTALPYPSVTRMSVNSGYTRANLQNIRASLVSRGYLRIVQRNKADGAQDSNAYDFGPLLDEIGKHLAPRPAEAEGAGDEYGKTLASGNPSNLSGTAAEAIQAARIAHTIGSRSGSRPDSGTGIGIGSGTGIGATGRKPKRGAGGAAGTARAAKASQNINNQGKVSSTKVDSVTQAGLPAQPGKASVTPRDIQYAPPHDTQYTEGGDIEYAVPRDAQYAPPRDAWYAEPAKHASPVPATRNVQSPMTSPLHEVESLIEQDEKNDSSRIAPISVRQNERDQMCTSGGGAQSRRDLPGIPSIPGIPGIAGTRSPSGDTVAYRNNIAYSTYIVQVASDFSYELGDGSHVLENASQTQRLWRASGLDEQGFVSLMYEAKSRTRTGQSTHGAAGLSNKMAYFFACLKSLLAEK